MNVNRIQIAALLLFAAVHCLPASGAFKHPGIAHSKESIQFVRTKIAAGEQPWSTAWTNLKASRYASLSRDPKPHERVERGPYNNPDIGSSEFTGDGRAAYYHALCWALAGQKDHAQKAVEILNAWSKTLKEVANHDARLLIGMSGYHYCIGAELMKHTWDGWAKADQVRFEGMLRDVWYPVIEDFYPSANGNWDASMLQVMMAMGVFLDDKKMFDRAKDYYLKGRGNGAIGNYFKPSGQCQESGRDQAHTQMGLE
ncbi:MAG: alginate lyase family protein, partial [Verrucomicrobiota bacterium]